MPAIYDYGTIMAIYFPEMILLEHLYEKHHQNNNSQFYEEASDQPYQPPRISHQYDTRHRSFGVFLQ